MINTIFYFADTQNEYMEKYNAGEISSKTITFVKDSNEIYIDGHGYIDRQSIIDYLVEDAQQKDQELASLIRSELATAESNLTRYVDDATSYAEGVHDDLQDFKTEVAQDISDSITAAITNAQGRTIWTELNTTNEGISAMTTRLNTSLDAAGNVKYTSALQSVINTGISNNTAFTDIASRYAVLDENQDIISWMTSGFKGKTNDTESFAAMYAAANQATQSAIAQVLTNITQDLQGNYVSKAGLATEVSGVLNDSTYVNSLSYVASKSDVTGAENRMTSKYDSLNTALGTTNATLSEVSTVANEGKARASLLTSAGPNGGYIVNETTLESSMVSIFNKAGDASTFIQLKATKAKEDAEATAQTLINTQASNAASTYATKDSLNNALTTIMSYITGEDGLISKEASLRLTVNANSAAITAIANNLEAGTTAGVVFESGLDDAVAGLLAQNSNANTKTAITQIASNEAASSDITTRMKNALGVTALTDVALKSYVGTQISNATTSILSEVDSKIGTATAGLISTTDSHDYTDTKVTTAKNDLTTAISTAVSNATAGLISETAAKEYTDTKVTTAKNDLTAAIATAKSEARAGLISEVDAKDYADEQIASAINDLSTSIAGDIATVENKIVQESTINSKIATAKQEVLTQVSTDISTATSGLASTSYADTAATTAANNLKAEIWDSANNKPKGLASLESSVSTANTNATNASNAASSATTALNNLKAAIYGDGAIPSSETTLSQKVTDQGSAITTLTSKVDSLSGVNTSELLLKSDLDEAVVGLLAANSDANTKTQITLIANNAAASSDITARMENALGVDALSNIAQKSYVTGEIAFAVNDLYSLVTSDIADAKSGLATNTYVDEHITSATNSLYSQVTEDILNAKSGLATNTYVTHEIGYAINDLYSTVTNDISRAKSGLATETYVNSQISSATYDLYSLIEDERETAISGLASRTYVDENITSSGNSLYSQVTEDILSAKSGLESSINVAKTNATNAVNVSNTLKAAIYGNGDIPTSLTTLSQRVTNTEASLSSLTAVVDELSGGTINSSGIVTEANIESAVAKLFSTTEYPNGNTVTSAIEAKVQDGASNITLTADRITFAGYSNFTLAVQAVDITASALAVKNANNVIVTKFDSDGSGWIANDGTSKGIEWTTSGGLTLNLKFLASLFGSLGDGEINNLSYKGVTDNIAGSISYGNALSMTMPFSTNIKADDEVFMSLYDEYIQTIKDTLFKRTSSGNVWYSYPKGSWDGLKFVTLENAYASKQAKTFIPFDVDESDPSYKPDILYGSVIVCGSSDSSDDKYPISGTERQKKDWYFNRVSLLNLSFDRGLLTSKDPIDSVYKKTKAEITSLEIDDLVYVEHNLMNDGGNAIAKYTNRLFVRAMNGEDVNDIGFKFDIRSGSLKYNTEDSVFIFKDIVKPDDFNTNYITDYAFELSDNDDIYIYAEDVELLLQYGLNANFDGVYSDYDLCTIFSEAIEVFLMDSLSNVGNNETIGICFYDLDDEPMMYVVFEKVPRKDVTQYKDFFGYNQDKIWADTSKWLGPAVSFVYDYSGQITGLTLYGHDLTNYTEGSWFYDSLNSLYIYGSYNIGPLVTPKEAPSVTTVSVTGWLHVTTNLSNYQIEKYTSSIHPLYHRKGYTSGQDRIVIYPNNKAALTVFEGQDLYVKADIIYSSTSNPTIQWSTSSSQIASIDGTETIHDTVYTVISGNKAGTAVISASTSNGGYSEITVNVIPIEINAIKLNKSNINLTNYQTYQLYYTESNNINDNIKHGVTYITSDKFTARVDSNGLVEAINPGTAIITAQSKKDPTKKDICVITIPEVADLGFSDVVWQVGCIGGNRINKGTEFTLSLLGGMHSYTDSPLLSVVMGEYKLPTKTLLENLVYGCRVARKSTSYWGNDNGKDDRINITILANNGQAVFLKDVPCEEGIVLLTSTVSDDGYVYCMRIYASRVDTGNNAYGGIYRYRYTVNHQLLKYGTSDYDKPVYIKGVIPTEYFYNQ